jgi:hypothetical protein
MELTKETARKILKIYGEAWVQQDIKKILSIFTKDGIYHERVLRKPMKGHKEIAKYWKTKVCEEQSNIKFKLLNFYISQNNIIAEWDASFNNNTQHVAVHIQEVAIMEIKGNKIKSLREYWQSEELPIKK